MKIIFLHTSKSHIKRFDQIIIKIDHTIETEHFVNEELLETVLKTGQIDIQGFKNEIQKIRTNAAESIICTCSTYGILCKEDEKVYRIDKPIIELIVSNYSNIGLAFTASSTKEVSKNLILNIAKRQGKKIKIKEIDCQNCWKYFEMGDTDKYTFEIANQIKKMGNNCEVIFLAQASMEKVKSYLLQEKYKTVSSPQYGIEKYLDRIKNHPLTR